MRELGLLTLKKVFYVANVAEKQLAVGRQRQVRQRACAPTPSAKARRSS